MNKEEIKEYLKKVDELEFKLVDEDKDALQWLIFGYNECARLLNEKEEENQSLKKQLEEYKHKGLYNTCLPYSTGYKKAIKEKENQQKEFINWLEENYEITQDIWYIKILNKYKEIIGGKE